MWVAEAKFQTRFFGSIYIVWVGMLGSLMDAIIYTNLEDRKSLKAELSTNNWKIFSTDVLETKLGMQLIINYNSIYYILNFHLSII